MTETGAATTTSRNAARWLFPLAAFVIPMLGYLTGLRYVGSGDTAPAELLPISILESGNLDFNEFVRLNEPLPYWFRRVGPRVVSSYPILPGLLNVPTYGVARALGLPLFERREMLSLLTASVISALSVLFLFLTLIENGMSRSPALFLSLAFAFGSCLWSVTSRGMWQHGPAVLFLSISLWLICRRSDRGEAWAGTFLALAVLTRPPMLLLAAPLAAAALLRRPRSIVAFTLAAAVPGVLHVWYTHAYLGTFLASGYWNAFPEVANFSGKPLAGLAGLLWSPSRGLLVFSPWFVFALPGILRGMRSKSPGRRALTLAMTAGIVATVALYSFWTTWWAGHAFGYRYLIELSPFLTMLVAFWWEGGSSRGVRVAFFVLLAWSLYVQFLGAWMQPSGFNELLDRDPGVLWSLRDSEVAISTRKLIEKLR